jgi:peptide/nickel transport system permease protein
MNYVKLFFSNKKSTVGVIIFLAFVVLALFAPYISPYSPNSMAFTPLQGPSWKHLLGTTAVGQDIFSQVIWGTRLSLMVGLVTGAIATILSVIVGLSSGYLGGITDDILMTITNIFLVIPGLPLIIIISAFIVVKGVWTIIFVISITG